MPKVYSVTVEVKLVIRATDRETAKLQARNLVAGLEDLESLHVVDVFCPAEGK